MALFFFMIGAVLLDSGVRGNARPLFAQLSSDVKGFVAFGAVVLVLAVAGISSSVRPIAKMMLALVFVVYFVKHGAAITQGVVQAASAKTNNLQSPADPNLTAAQSTGATSDASGGTDFSNPGNIINQGLSSIGTASQWIENGLTGTSGASGAASKNSGGFLGGLGSIISGAETGAGVVSKFFSLF